MIELIVFTPVSYLQPLADAGGNGLLPFMVVTRRELAPPA